MQAMSSTRLGGEAGRSAARARTAALVCTHYSRHR